jgi:hypothetical protein
MVFAHRSGRLRAVGMSVRSALLLVTCVALGVATPSSAREGQRGLLVRGGHLSVMLPLGAWDGRFDLRPPAPPALTFANVALGRWQYMFGQNDPTTAWRPSSLMISVIDETDENGKRNAEPVSLPLKVRARDVLGLEGIPPNHALLRRTVRVSGRVVEVWVQLGHRRVTANDLSVANRLLRRVAVTRS